MARPLRVLLTGSNGQLGRAILEVTERDSDVEMLPAVRAAAAAAAPAAVELDLRSPLLVSEVVRTLRPDVILHTAAMTNVDACEADPAGARGVNAEATGLLARAAAESGARMVYVSTDYVFDGERGGYREDDATNPIQVYGATKLEGERLAAAELDDLVVARTSVVFGPHKKNFVTWLVGELRAGRGVRIVRDQLVSPTLTYDLAEQILALVRSGARGTFHTAGATALSRLDMALETCRVFGLDEGLVTPVLSSDLAWKARRPRDSTLDVSKASKYQPPLPFEAALSRLKRELDLRGLPA